MNTIAKVISTFLTYGQCFHISTKHLANLSCK